MGHAVRWGVSVVSLLGVGIPHSFWMFLEPPSKAHIHCSCLKAEISPWQGGSELVPSDCSHCISVTSHPYISLWAPLLLLIAWGWRLGAFQNDFFLPRQPFAFWKTSSSIIPILLAFSYLGIPSYFWSAKNISSSFPVIWQVCYFKHVFSVIFRHLCSVRYLNSISCLFEFLFLVVNISKAKVWVGLIKSIFRMWIEWVQGTPPGRTWQP